MKFGFLALCISIPFLSPAQTDYSGMVNCFKQGSKDNAASISLIKASIAAFDVGKVFEEKVVDGVMNVTLKNGNKYTLTPQELKEATIAADLHLKDCKDSTALKYANRCYALMAKQRQAEANTDYTSALKYLEGEADVETVYRLLGLERNIKKFRNGAYVENLCAIVAWKGNDVVFSCNGLMDRKGKQINMNILYRGRFQVVDEWDADPPAVSEGTK